MPVSNRTAEPRVAPIRLEQFLPYRLSVLANTVSRSLAQVYSERYGLTVPEWRVLAVLARFAPLSSSDVAERTAMDKVKVSRAVSRLLDRKMLTRGTDDTDRRRSILELADEGWRIYAEIVPLAHRCQQGLEQALTTEEAAILDKLLTKLQVHAEGAV